MAYYVYIIQSELDQSYYKGFTESPLFRLERHNNGESNYTRKKIPWRFIYLQAFDSKTEAFIREKSLKKYSHSQIQSLINTPLNILSDFLKQG